jgi:transcriptional regulator with XRE-family HTH domain
MTATLNLKSILGIKLKRLREARRFTLAEVSRRTGVSTSYLAEIEAGKKYPKPDRLLQIAQGLDCPYDELISTKLDQDLEALQAVLNVPGVRDFPFERFGVPVADLVKLLTRSPNEIRALLRTLDGVARQYNIEVEHFLRAALRSYQELTGNYEEAIEREAEAFARLLGRPAKRGPAVAALRAWVLAHCVREIDDRRLAAVGSTLRRFRAVRVPGARDRLLIHPGLSESQVAFVLAREAGYHRLGLKARSLTTPSSHEDSFEQVMNDFQASYFAGAVLLPRGPLVADLRKFFRLPTWQPPALLRLLELYRVTPETLMHRISQLAPSQFGLRAHFIKFSDEDGQLRLVKALHVPGLSMPPGFLANEHYCRRWLATRLLLELRARRARLSRDDGNPLVGAQHSRFVEDRQDGSLVIGLALPQPLRPDVNISLAVGFRPDDTLFRTVRFARDPAVPEVLVNGTCERCALGDEACRERAAPPTRHLRDLARARQQEELGRLSSEW